MKKVLNCWYGKSFLKMVKFQKFKYMTFRWNRVDCDKFTTGFGVYFQEGEYRKVTFDEDLRDYNIYVRSRLSSRNLIPLKTRHEASRKNFPNSRTSRNSIKKTRKSTGMFSFMFKVTTKVCWAHLHQAHISCVTVVIPSQTYGNVWWWSP